MSCYISSNNERIYCALESSFGMIPAITGANRIPALKFKAKQVPEQIGRKDKTGTRTFVGLPNRVRESTSFAVDTLLTEWSNTSAQPAYGPLFQCAMGGTPVIWAGGTVASLTGTTEIAFTAPHGLSAGQAVTFNGEMRFVTAILNPSTIYINAGFTTLPVAGSAMGPTINYGLADSLPSASIFDYWDPSTAVQRIVGGGGDRQDADRSERRFSAVQFLGAGAGLGGQRELPKRPGWNDAISGRAGGGEFRLHDRAGTFGRGVAGCNRGPVPDNHGGGIDA